METMNLQGELSVAGDKAIGNMSPRIKLLERLGYIESEAVKEKLVEYRDIADYWRRLLDPKVFYPTVYKFSVVVVFPLRLLDGVSNAVALRALNLGDHHSRHPDETLCWSKDSRICA
jgi:hypothetical protein